MTTAADQKATAQGASNAQGTQDAGQEGDKGETPKTYEAWLQAQDEATKALVDSHTKGLRSALASEREAREALQKQVKELGKAAGATPELQAQLEQVSARFEAISQKAAFYESAPADVANIRLAYLAAQDAGLIGKDGTGDWKRLREQTPELFRKAVVPAGNAGNGAGQAGRRVDDMNARIRAMAGRTG